MLSPCSFAAALIGLGEDLHQHLDRLVGGWLANAIDAGSQTYVSWLPVRTNSMVDLIHLARSPAVTLQ